MSFPFLQLATETRLPIYRLLLPYSEYRVEDQRNDTPVRWYRGKYSCPSILLVNRQIHGEAAEILYQENFFAIYVKHPSEPRLPWNESRADPESFMFISWARSPEMEARREMAWAHPTNPRAFLSGLGSHHNFHHIRKLHVSLPPFDGLAGVDMFMKKTSFAAFNGVNAWIEKCAKKEGDLDVAEKKRMSIVKHFKDPIDKLGKLLQIFERIDQLCISTQASEFQITFSEYLIEELLKVGPVARAACYLAPTLGWKRNNASQLWSQLRRWEDLLQLTHEKQTKDYQLPLETDSMYRLLEAIRTYQQLDFVRMPDWLSPMPA